MLCVEKAYHGTLYVRGVGEGDSTKKNRVELIFKANLTIVQMRLQAFSIQKFKRDIIVQNFNFYF